MWNIWKVSKKLVETTDKTLRWLKTIPLCSVYCQQNNLDEEVVPITIDATASDHKQENVKLVASDTIEKLISSQPHCLKVHHGYTLSYSGRPELSDNSAIKDYFLTPSIPVMDRDAVDGKKSMINFGRLRASRKIIRRRGTKWVRYPMNVRDMYFSTSSWHQYFYHGYVVYQRGQFAGRPPSSAF